MKRVLFVSNGHGESAIAARIAREVAARSTAVALDHLQLVGSGRGDPVLRLVGPQRSMPSGGLVAMGNVAALANDLRAGLGKLALAQAAFLRGARNDYDVAVAVGDTYALALTLLARLPNVFVGTAKSVYVAPYGAFERTLLRRARRIFVRDEPTARQLRLEGVAAESPGNVIADMIESDAPAPPAGPWIGILPGSRNGAYADAVRLARVVRALSRRHGPAAALVSVAPNLDADRMAQALSADGWEAAEAPSGAFALYDGEARLVGWTGALAALLHACRLVVGQAGTANEQAAALGLPVVTLEADGVERRVAGGAGWYRMRQRRLLGEALVTAPAEPYAAAEVVAGILADRSQYERMRAAGRERMGAPGGATAIAQAILEIE